MTGRPSLLLLIGAALFCPVSRAQEIPAAPVPAPWPYPEQERWVEEPVFEGTLHLIEAGAEHRETIVLIHGLGQRAALDWAALVPELAERYHVVAIDLPGFGSSESRIAQYAPARYAELVSWVVGEHARDEVIVIGHSMGGAVGLRFAHDYPRQLDRLIMIDTAGVLQRTVYVRHLAKLPIVRSPRLVPFQDTVPGLDALLERLASRIDGITRPLLALADGLPDVSALMMSTGLARQFLYKDSNTLNAALELVYADFSAAAREVEVPVHIIWGDDDPVAPLRTGRALAHTLPNAELHVIPDSGHVPMLDNPEAFRAALNRSLTADPTPGAARARLDEIAREPAAHDLECESELGTIHTGRYRRVSLLYCRDVTLRDLVAEEIEMIGADAVLENVRIESAGTGLIAIASTVTATVLEIDAGTPLVVERSFVDVAAADLVSRERLIEIRSESELYFSLSEHTQDGVTRTLHGVSVGPTLELR